MKREATITAINQRLLTVQIESITGSPLVQHQWSEKSMREMREKQAGRKTKSREVRDPVAEYEAAKCLTEDGAPGVSVLAIKSAIISAAHKDLGIEKTLVRKALFIRGDRLQTVPLIDYAEPYMREDTVRVGMGSTDLRYRPCYDYWACKLRIEYDASLLRVEDILNLINRAGFGVGICERRPEKGGDWGRFRLRDNVTDESLER